MNVTMSMTDWAINPTVVHETYHTLASKQKMFPNDVKAKLRILINDRRTHCFNLTKTISLYSLDLASEFNLGGRDSLIVGCYLRNRVNVLLTHDGELLRIASLRFRGREIEFRDPIVAKHS